MSLQWVWRWDERHPLCVCSWFSLGCPHFLTNWVQSGKSGTGHRGIWLLSFILMSSNSLWFWAPFLSMHPRNPENPIERQRPPSQGFVQVLTVAFHPHSPVDGVRSGTFRGSFSAPETGVGILPDHPSMRAALPHPRDYARTLNSLPVFCEVAGMWSWP